MAHLYGPSTNRLNELHEHLPLVGKQLNITINSIASLANRYTVTNEINVPRFPTLMQIMATSKKEILEWNAIALGFRPEQVGNQGSAIQILKIDALTVKRKNILVDGGNDSEKAMKLAMALQKEGVIQ